MESLNNKYISLKKALKTLEQSLEVLDKEQEKFRYEMDRDSVIKRFEYTFDTFWKFFKEYLENKGRVVFVSVSPKMVYRECLKMNLISDEEYKKLYDMTDDRNMTVHTYNDILAEDISERIHEYAKVLHVIIAKTEL